MVATDWLAFRKHRQSVLKVRGQGVWILDRNYDFVMDVEDWISATWTQQFGDTGSMEMVIPGEVSPGVQNPVISYLLGLDLTTLNNPEKLDDLFHSGINIVVERLGERRRCYKVTELVAEGGDEYPRQLTIRGVDLVEHMKHLPCWANPSNRSKVVQLQFSDIQSGEAEHVSRKLLGRNLLGYFQPSLLRSSASWTGDYEAVERWSAFQPDMHPIIVSPIKSGMRSEWTVVEARWDNAWDLMKPTWDAAGVMPLADLWLPGDRQPFPSHATLNLPTVVLNFVPRSVVTGARTMIGQAIGHIDRVINSDDNISSVMAFKDAAVKNYDGRDPWVVFDFDDAPTIHVKKSTDSRFLVGGQSPKIVNDIIEVGIKSAVAALVASIPFIGPGLAEIIKGGGELLAKMSANRFLNLNEFTDKVRRHYHGRSGYVSLSKAGQANTLESLQKAWQAKQETEGGLAIEFLVEDVHPYAPGRDFHLGDTVGVAAWGAVWAAYVAELTWVSEPGKPMSWHVKLGDLASLANPDQVFALNYERVMGVLNRWSTYVTS